MIKELEEIVDENCELIMLLARTDSSWASDAEPNWRETTPLRSSTKGRTRARMTIQAKIMRYFRFVMTLPSLAKEFDLSDSKASQTPYLP